MTSFSMQVLGSFVAGILIFVPPQAAAEEATAIIEDAPPGSGLAAMDYVAQGQTISLAPGQVLIVGYLSSCVREVINGGKVTIGTERSEVTGGTVTRKKVDCAGAGGLLLSQEQTQQSGVMISRSARTAKINSLQPVFSLPADGVLKIVRQDKSGTQVEIAVSGRRVIDLADESIVLEAGAVYEAKIGEHVLKFKVSRTAAPGKNGLLSRLLAF